MQEPRSGPGLGTVMLVAAMTAAGVSCGVLLLAQRGMLPGFRITAQNGPAAEAFAADVPELSGVTPAVAGELLDARELRMNVTGKRHDPRVATGSIVEQTPLAGSTLNPGSTVNVVVSLGPEAKRGVPDVAGLPVQEAHAQLAAAGMRVRIEPASAADDAKVVRSEPAAGTALDPGSPVVLVTQTGVEVPKLVGLRFSVAVDTLKEAGLKTGRVRETYNENRRSMVILAQDPEPGTRVPAKSKVDLTRNEGD